MAIKNRSNKTRKTLRVKVTKIARRTCGRFLDHCGCLLATSIKRQFPATVKHVYAGFSWVSINGIDYEINSPQRISDAYDHDPKVFKPFAVTLVRNNA